MMTLAPERPGALDTISWLSAHGIIAACGHTDATYDNIQAAVGHGLQHAVHTFNAMLGLHHREPGTAGAVLTDARLCAEVIADGLHVHPACIALLAQLKTQRNLVLITDAMSAAGLGDGDYSLGGLDVIVKDGAARLKQGGSLAGSTLTMIDAFRYVVRTVGLTVPQASVLASGNPARRLGLFDAAGSIAAGKRADLLRIGRDLALRQVWLRGRAL
jgi:N-acetylglucosamine-6-phosphate deacetylase